MAYQPAHYFGPNTAVALRWRASTSKGLAAGVEDRLSEKAGELGEPEAGVVSVLGKGRKPGADHPEALGKARIQFQSEIDIGFAVLQSLGELYRSAAGELYIRALRLQFFDRAHSLLESDFRFHVSGGDFRKVQRGHLAVDRNGHRSTVDHELVDIQGQRALGQTQIRLGHFRGRRGRAPGDVQRKPTVDFPAEIETGERLDRLFSGIEILQVQPEGDIARPADGAAHFSAEYRSAESNPERKERWADRHRPHHDRL